jgi:hypothetical protein
MTDTGPVTLGPIKVSAEMFKTMTERARRIAELQFAQCHFDTPPDVQAKLREIGLIERLTDSNIARWVAMAAAEIEAKRERAAKREAAKAKRADRAARSAAFIVECEDAAS